MTPIERYTHLVEFWKSEAQAADDRFREAVKELSKWKNKLTAAEIAEKRAKGDQ